MAETITAPRTTEEVKPARPKLHKVILLNDDYTPREFVVRVLKAVFRMSEGQAHAVMITAHQRGACVIAVFARRGDGFGRAGRFGPPCPAAEDCRRSGVTAHGA